MQRVDCDELDFSDDYVMRWHDLPFTGVAVEYAPDGSVISEITYKEGQECGLSRSWYPNGQIEFEANYGEAGGMTTVRQWHPNGQLHKLMTSKMGTMISSQEWDALGNEITGPR